MILPGALLLIDLLLGGSVEGTPIAAPPATPVLGRFYRVAGSGAVGDFTGHGGQLAGWSEGGWRFVTPVEGLRLTDRASGVDLAYRDGQWTSGSSRVNELLVDGVKVVGARQAPIAAASGGSVVDSQLRSCVEQILVSLRAHGLIGA